jgi:glycosyltransferase involved in cell wall biosynthesis
MSFLKLKRRDCLPFSDQGGPRELIRDGETGFVTKGKDADSLFQAMRQLTTNVDLRRKMSESARQQMKQRTWDHAFETFWS